MSTQDEASDRGTIYGLFDPHTGDLRYVGMTKNGAEERLRGHLWHAKNGKESRRSNWIRKLSASDLIPEVQVLEDSIHPDDLPAHEESWIEWARDAGHPLTNETEGGEGGLTPGSGTGVENHRSDCTCSWCDPRTETRTPSSVLRSVASCAKPLSGRSTAPRPEPRCASLTSG